MDKKNFRRCLLPYVVAVACFAAVCGLYFAPQFEGRELRMHDIVQYEGSARDIDDHRAGYGEDPQWTGNSFSGMPASLISIKYPGQILKQAFPVFEFMGMPAALIFIAMAAFFAMLAMFRVNPWVAIPAALAYGLSTYFLIIIGAGHITKMVACAYAPLIVGGVYCTLRRNMWLGAALTAFFASLQIAANHPQITYYFVFIILALWINELVRAVRKKLMPRFVKATGLLAVAAVLAVGSNFAPLWYISEWSEDSIRGGSELTQADGAHERKAGLDLDYATAWSYGIGETFNMYVPNLYGGSANFSEDGPVADALAGQGQRGLATRLSSYWGDQPVTGGPTYLGAVAIFFAVLALFMLPRRKTLWVAVVSLLAIMLAWGHNFMWLTKLFFYYFPGYDKFRTVAMILVIVEWTVPFLGALALAKLWRSSRDGRVEYGGEKAGILHGVSKEKLMQALKYTVIVLGGISLFFLLFGGMLFDFSSQSDAYYEQYFRGISDSMRAERASMMRADALRSLIFVLLGAGVVFLYARGRIKRGVMVALAAVLVCIDLVVVDMRFLSHSSFEFRRKSTIEATDADRQIMQDPEPGFRVFNVTGGINAAFNEANTSYFHRSLGGYHGAKMQRYQDIIDRYLGKADMGVINMLNTKYVIQADQQGHPVVTVNPEANGAAWFVETITIVATPDEEIAALATIDNKREAVVDGRFGHLLTATATTADSTSYIELTEYRPNYLKYDYYASDETFAVFSEIYYDKGWQAYLDGEPKEHFRADYILRGMVLPAGNHTVEFRFRAQNFDRVSNITLVFSLLIIASLAATIVAAVLCKRGKQDERPETEA